MEDPVDSVLSNQMLLSHILSFIHGKEFLKCRRVSKYWDTEVLHAYPKKSSLVFHPGRYMNQVGLENGRGLPFNSPLPKRTQVLESFISSLSPAQVLAFLRERGNAEVFKLEVVGKPPKMSWGQMLHFLFREDSLANLREFSIKMFGLTARIQFPVEASFYLPNLKKLEIGDTKEESDSNFLHFLQCLVDNSPNLAELTTYGNYYPQIRGSCRIKYLELNSLRSTCRSQLSKVFPEIERVLNQVSSSLEELNMFLQIEPNKSNLFQQNLKLPKMPRLKKYASPAFSPIPFPDLVHGDFISFLREKLPALETFRFSAIDECISGKEQDILANAFSRSEKTHENLKILRIPKPSSEEFYSKIKERLPKLKELKVVHWPSKTVNIVDLENHQ